MTEKKEHGFLVWNKTQKRVEATLGLMPDKEAAEAHIAQLEESNGRTDAPVDEYQAVQVEV